MKLRKEFSVLYILNLCCILYTGCNTLPVKITDNSNDAQQIEKKFEPDKIRNDKNTEIKPEIELLNLTFAGDIMAHSVNFEMNNYGNIYEDVRSIILSDDLTFANLETPIHETIPMSTYPRFNVHTSYVQSAVSAGFEVFALANNHSNDQGSEGINGTIEVMSAFLPNVYFSGLKKDQHETMKPQIINVKNWKIIFLSITEILNSYDSSGKLVYYVAPNEKERTTFLSYIKQLRIENECDIFILSIHLNEPEYVRTVIDKKKQWFSQLSSAGVDIIWGHHPHVMQEWEIIQRENDVNKQDLLYMYSMGNFISGQRYTPELSAPGGFREYTGDGVLLQVNITRTGTIGYDNMKVNPVLITNYSERGHGVVVRNFNTSFIDSLQDNWKQYYTKRLDLMMEYLPLLP